MSDATLEISVQQALEQLHAAMAQVANGDVAAIKALYARSNEATSFYGWGGYEKGWESVSKRWGWAARSDAASPPLVAPPCAWGGLA